MAWTFYVDDYACELPCDVTRVSEMRSSEISGMMLDKTYFNDVLGTFLVYTVKIAVPIGMMEDYCELYDILTQPVDGHTFMLPYHMGTVNIVGRVESISDVYRRLGNGGMHWTGISFRVISNEPYKTMSLGQAIERGRTSLPEVNEPEEGATYTYTNGEWVPVEG